VVDGGCHHDLQVMMMMMMMTMIMMMISMMTIEVHAMRHVPQIMKFMMGLLASVSLQMVTMMLRMVMTTIEF